MVTSNSMLTNPTSSPSVSFLHATRLFTVIPYICEMYCPANVIMMVAVVLAPNRHVAAVWIYDDARLSFVQEFIHSRAMRCPFASDSVKLQGTNTNTNHLYSFTLRTKHKSLDCNITKGNGIIKLLNATYIWGSANIPVCPRIPIV